MGHVIKKILGNRDDDPFYETFTIEVNECVSHRKLQGIRNHPGEVHFHAKNLRFDLKWKDYKTLRDACIDANRSIKKKEIDQVDSIDTPPMVIPMYDKTDKTYFQSNNGGGGYLVIPENPGDKIVKRIVGKNVQAFRIVENSGYSYFDSIVPLKGFYLRGESPRRFLDILALSKERKEKLINLSRRQDNNLVEIVQIFSDYSNFLLVRMPFLHGLPLAPELSAIELSEEACTMSGQIYNTIISEQFKKIPQQIYDSFFRVNSLLIKDVGLYLTDIAPNNIVLHIERDEIENYLNVDFRFVDILDIKCYRGEPFTVDMSRLFSITRDRLPIEFKEQLRPEILDLFPKLSDLNEEDKRSKWEERIENLFKMIDRKRYQTFGAGE